MMDIGLSPTQRIAYRELLLTHHIVYTRLSVLNNNGDYLGNISDRFLGGQVDIDITADVKRSMDVDILDPNEQLGLDPRNPNSGAMFADKMLRAWYCVSPPDMSMSYDVPVFTGPITKLERKGPVLSVECSGKESFAMMTMRSPLSFNARLLTVNVIKSVMMTTGETKFNVVDRLNRTANKMDFGKDKVYWTEAQRLIHGMGCVGFYDGRGVLQIKPRSYRPVWHFDGRCLLSEPMPGYSLDNVYNVVDVTGDTPKGAKVPIKYRAVAPKSEPMAPWNIGRNNTPRALVHAVENTNLHTLAAVKEVAFRTLRSDLLMSLDTQFDALVVPGIEEYDPYKITTDQWTDNAAVQKASIPLTADGRMTIGSNKRVTPRRRALHFRSL